MAGDRGTVGVGLLDGFIGTRVGLSHEAVATVSTADEAGGAAAGEVDIVDLLLVGVRRMNVGGGRGHLVGGSEVLFLWWAA